MIGAFLCKNKEMMELKFIIFMVGVIVGSLFGMITMCLVQINKQSEDELRKAELSHSEVSSEAKN
jgi:heme/copper-type cytochrome/quinol oxidase subunit 2